MNLSDPKVQALIWRFLLILAVTDLPIVAAQLSQPTFDWRLMAAGLITGLCGALEKLLSPQLASVILPDVKIIEPVTITATVTEMPVLPSEPTP